MKPRPAHRPPRTGVTASEVVKARVTPEVKKRWQDAAEREGLTLTDWLTAAAELALARGSTR